MFVEAQENESLEEEQSILLHSENTSVLADGRWLVQSKQMIFEMRYNFSKAEPAS